MELCARVSCSFVGFDCMREAQDALSDDLPTKREGEWWNASLCLFVCVVY